MATTEIIGCFRQSPITVPRDDYRRDQQRPSRMYIIHRGSAGLDLAARKAVFESTHPFVVVKAAEELFTVNPADWSKKLDGTASGVTTDGLSLDGNFVIRYPTFWFRIQTLGTDIHSCEWTHDNPGSGNGWVCLSLARWHYRSKRVGVTKGSSVITNSARYTVTECPTVSRSHQSSFIQRLRQPGPAEGVTGENPYTITQPLVYMMRCISNTWTYGTLNLKHYVARGLVDDTTFCNWRRPVCVGVSPTGGYTQGASSQEYTDNTLV